MSANLFDAPLPMLSILIKLFSVRLVNFIIFLTYAQN